MDESFQKQDYRVISSPFEATLTSQDHSSTAQTKVVVPQLFLNFENVGFY